MMNGTGAADDLQDSGGTDVSEDNEENQNPATFFLPPDFLGGKTYKKGQTIELTVIGEDEDGDTEVSLKGGSSGEKPWQDDLKASLSSAGDGGNQM